MLSALHNKGKNMNKKWWTLAFPSEIETRVMELAKILSLEEDRDRFAYRIVDILIGERKDHNFLFPSVEARNQSLSGRGVFAIENIRAWEQVAKFWWNITHITDWFAMPEEVRMWHIMVGAEFTIWSTDMRDIDGGDFINHSCNPNCWVQWHLDLIAMRDIHAWDEIVFDYGTVVWGIDIEELWWADALWEHLNSKGAPIVIPECWCGSKECRGEITWNDWKDLMTDERYRWFFPYHVQKIIDNSL